MATRQVLVAYHRGSLPGVRPGRAGDVVTLLDCPDCGGPLESVAAEVLLANGDTTPCEYVTCPCGFRGVDLSLGHAEVVEP